MKILLIDDEKKRNIDLVKDLELHYNVEICWLRLAKEVEANLNETISCIILDIMLPIDESITPPDLRLADNGISTGLVIYRKIRTVFPNLPILILSARGDLNSSFPGDQNISILQKPQRTADIHQEIIRLTKKLS